MAAISLFDQAKTVVSLVEGWRGVLCHVVQTSADGEIETYKVVDPSVHNWMGLAIVASVTMASQISRFATRASTSAIAVTIFKSPKSFTSNHIIRAGVFENPVPSGKAIYT